MRLHHFNDDELSEQLKLLKKKGNNKKEDTLEEYKFIASCLQVGLTIQDLKEFDYIDVAKILICMIPQEQKYKKATEEDWNKLM